MEKLKVILDKFLKNKNNTVLYIILIIGIGILILPGTFSHTDKSAKKTAVQSSGNSPASPSNNLEENLSKILSEINGAGKVSVMISYENTGKKVLAYDSKESTDTSDETDSARTKYDSKHTEEKNIIISESLPIVVEEEYAKVKGVIVVSEGANDPNIKQALTEAVGAVCDVPIHKIKVFVKK